MQRKTYMIGAALLLGALLLGTELSDPVRTPPEPAHSRGAASTELGTPNDDLDPQRSLVAAPRASNRPSPSEVLAGGDVAVTVKADQPVQELELLLCDGDALTPRIERELLAGSAAEWTRHRPEVASARPLVGSVWRIELAQNAATVVWEDVPTNHEYRLFARHDAVYRVVPMHEDWTGATRDGHARLPRAHAPRCPASARIVVAAGGTAELAVECLTHASLRVVTAGIGAEFLELHLRRFLPRDPVANPNFAVNSLAAEWQGIPTDEFVEFEALVPGTFSIHGHAQMPGGTFRILHDTFVIPPGSRHSWNVSMSVGTEDVSFELPCLGDTPVEVQWILSADLDRGGALVATGRGAMHGTAAFDGLPGSTGKLTMLWKRPDSSREQRIVDFDTEASRLYRVE